jgi:hypothetical protein
VTQQIRGRVRPELYFPDRGCVAPPGVGWRDNTLVATHKDLLARWARPSADGLDYRLAVIYVEFENNGGASVTPPAYGDEDPAGYYAGLGGDPNRDYLRIVEVFHSITSTDEAAHPLGDVLTLLAITAGSTGVHGKPFGSASQSRVYGGAVAAAPVPADPARDVFWSRAYFSNPVEQLSVPSGGQVTLRWPITF